MTKIYIVHMDALDGKDFDDISNDELKAMYDKDNMYIDCYDSLQELADAWNADEIFYPNMTYMRIVEEE